MTVDLVLLARAARDPLEAAILTRTLRVERRPHDRADARALRVWSVLLDLLARSTGPTDLLGMSRAAGVDHVVRNALEVPLAAVDSAGQTHELVAVWNRGDGTRWRHPAFRERSL